MNHKTIFMRLFFKTVHLFKVNFPCQAGGPHIPQGGGKLSGKYQKLLSNRATEFKLLVMIFQMFIPQSEDGVVVRHLTFNSFSFLHL